MTKKPIVKKNEGARLSQRFFGKREQTFGERSKKPSTWRGAVFAIVATLACLSLAVGAIYWGINRVGRANSAEALLGEDFDPIKDYDSVIEVGTLGQKITLLGALESAPVVYASPPVQLDRLGKISDVARDILEYDSLSEEQRVRAVQSRIRALWHLYYVKLSNKLDSRQTTQKFFDFVKVHLDDSSEEVSKAAHIAYVRGLAGETINKKFEEKLADFEDEVELLLTKFSNDPTAMRTAKVVFTQLRSADSQKAVDLAKRVTGLARLSDTEEGKDLSRFLDDIILLYENGIGDLAQLGGILDDEKEFHAKMLLLAEQYDCGETVMTQLDNGIEFLERQRNHELAIELGEKVLASAEHREDPAMAKMARKIGNDGITRNRLPNSKWDYVETDHLGNQVNSERFDDNVCLIVFFSPDPVQTETVLRSVSGLSRALTGRNVQYVFVEVAQNATDRHNLSKSKQIKSPILLTSQESPNNYLKQCPTSRLPYLVLIDKNGNVDSINVSLSVVITRIEHLLSKN